MEKHPLYSAEHTMEKSIVPIVIFLTKCFGNANYCSQQYNTCVRLLHHFGRNGTWGSGEISWGKVHLEQKMNTSTDEREKEDLKQAIRIIETVEQMMCGERYRGQTSF
jgi:hypothetical protein